VGKHDAWRREEVDDLWELKTATFKEETKMANGKEGGEEFAIEGGLFLLSGR
jgi:hypothetical protein